MTFLYPEFLWAISLIAIPIIIHLFNFRRYKKIYYSDISLLKSIKTETKNRSQLKHLLILFSRIIALCCLILAFCFPFKPYNNQLVEIQKIAGLYLDNSLSMSTKNQNDLLLDIAKQQALDLVEQYPSSSRFLFTTNDFETNLQRDISKTEIKKLIAETNPTYIQKSFSEIYLRQSDLLREYKQNKDVFWLTDLQKTTSSISNISLDTSMFIHLLPFSNVNVGNIYIDTVWFDTPTRRVNKQEFINVKLINTHKSKLSFRVEALFNTNETKGLNSGEINAESQLIVKIPFMVRQPGIKHVEIKLLDYADPSLIFDDTYFISYKINDTFNILHLSKEESEASKQKYFSSLFSTIPNANFISYKIGSLDYSKIRSQDLIIIENINEVNSGLIASLQEFIDAGKSLIVFPGNEINYSSYNKLYSKYGIEFQKLDTTIKKVTKLNYQHPIYSTVFEEIKENINLPIVRENYLLNISSNSNSLSVVSMSNEAPFLIETKENNGSIYTFTTSTDLSATDFIKHAIFVPTILRITELCETKSNLSHEIGRDQIIKSQINISDISALKINSVNKSYVFIPGYKKTQQNSLILINKQIDNPGNYNVTYDNAILEGFAYNYSRNESNMEFLSLDDFNSNLETSNLSGFIKTYDTIDKQKFINFSNETKGILYWKHFIILTLVFLGLEILLIRII
jgi:hypothetical protein